MRWFNLDKSQKLLHVNPKTFVRWLKEAGIEPKKDPADPRPKLISEDHLRILAEKHGRTLILPPEDEAEELPAPVTLPTLDERLSMFEQQITSRLDALEAQNQQILQVLADLHQHQSDQVQPASSAIPFSDPEPSSPAPALVSPAQPAKPVARTSPATSLKKSIRKTTTRVRKLPATLIPLRVFARLHTVPEKAAEHAVERGKITVSRGKWLYDSQRINLALDQQGQQQFYVLFHERADFHQCDNCPHIA